MMSHRRRLAWLGLLLAIGLGAGPRLHADEAVQDKVAGALDRAQKLVEAGRPGDAVDSLEEVLAALPKEDDDGEKRAAVSAALGRAYVASGEPYAALQHYEEALRLRTSPEDALGYADVLIAVARSHMSGGGAASVQVLPYLLDALDAAALAGDGEETRDEKRAVMGEARYWMGELEEAAELLATVDQAALDPMRAQRTAELLAHALYASGRFEDAARAFESAGNVRGAASAWSAARRGDETVKAYEVLLRSGAADARLLHEALTAARYADAEAELAQVLASLDVDESTRAAWLAVRGQLAAAVGEYEAAVGLLESAAEADPSSPDALYALGQVVLAAPGDDADVKADRAAAAWLAALGRAPGDERVLAALWDQSGRDYAMAWRSPPALARSIRMQRAIVEAHPDDGLAWGNLGNTLRVAGRLEDALAAYDRSKALEASDPVIASDRGLVLSALGRKDAALEAFLAAAALDPDHDAAWQNAARLYWRMGRDDEASRALAEGLRCLRSAGRSAGRYRFLLDRAWRTSHREALR